MRATLLAILLALVTPVFAAPRISHLYPAGGQRGTRVKVSFSGSELKGITGLYTTGAGLTAKIEAGGDAANRSVEIAIAPDAPLGIQQVRLYDANGLSNARYFRVGQWPEQAEKEPNDTPGDALKVSLPVTLNGRIQQGTDRDGVTFPAKPGEAVVCEVEALRILGQVGDSWLKGYLEIQDGNGNTLAESQGTADDYYRWDPLIVFTPTKEGNYTLFYRDLNWRGAPMAIYRLTIGVVPHAVGIFPLGGQRGQTVDVRFVGPNLADAVQKVTVPANAPDPLLLAHTGPGGVTNLRPFHVSDLPQGTRPAENRTRETAHAVNAPCIVDGRIERENERHFYKFTLDKPQRLNVEVFSRRVGTPMDADLTLYDAKGTLLQIADDERDRDPHIERDFAAGEYVVAVRDVDDRGGPAFSYRLLIAPPKPHFRLIALPDAPVLKRGGTVNLAVKLERRDGFDGEVAVTVNGLPAGVTAAPLTLAKDKAEGQLTLTAAADAAPGPARLEVVGTGKAGEREIRDVARTQETYNIQGTAFQRDLLGPVLLVTEK